MRLSGIWSRLSTRLKQRVQQKKQAATRLHLERLTLESLEDRTLLSVSPPPVVPDVPGIISAGTAHSPILASDPTNPNNIVAVYSQFVGNDVQGAPVYRIRGAYSLDRGESWTNFQPMGGYTNQQTTRPFHHASTPSITWDRQGNFYVVATISDDGAYVGGTNTAGVLVLSKFQFDAFSGPTQQFEDVLWRWYLQEPVYNPVVAVDNNLPSYTDPETGASLVDTMAGKAVYVAWNTNTQNTLSGNGGNGIRMMASSDGGSTFTTPVWVNDGGPTAGAVTGPQILFTQGSLDGVIEAGRMIVAWANGGSVVVDSSRPDDGQIQNRVADVVVLQHPGPVFLVDADAGNNTGTTDIIVYVNDIDDRLSWMNPAQYANSRFVNINTIDKTFGEIVDLDVSFTLRHPHLNQTRAEVRKLNTSGGLVNSAILWTNRTDNAGNNDPFNRGLADVANMGTLLDVNSTAQVPNIVNVGVTFDQQSGVDVRASGITNATYQYIGRYRPEQSVFGPNNYDSGGLNVFNGLTRDELRGAWVLRIQDTRSDGSTAPVQFISNLEFRISSHISRTRFAQDQVVGGTAGGAANNLHPNVVPAAPNGTAPTIRLAQDNSLGSYSPYQGRVYMVYTGNSGTDTDINLVYDDNAGQGGLLGWTGVERFINDDWTGTDETDKINSTGTRSQFTPAISVDPVTGAVVVSWYDARYDAANWRVSTFVSVSVDGGSTFSRQDREGFFGKDGEHASFLNEAKTAIDTITGKTIVIEPIPSNMAAAGVPNYNGVPQGFGWQMGLVAYGGKLTAAWAGNRNAAGSSIYTNNAYYTAGPRIIETDSGPVLDEFEIELTENSFLETVYKTVTYNTSFGPDGRRRLDSMIVRFDRPIDVNSFTVDDVQVMFRSPTTPASIAPTSIAVGDVIPLDDDRPGGFGEREVSAPGEFASVFQIMLLTPQVQVGTYSLAVGPDIRDKIRKPHVEVTPSGTTLTQTSTPNGTITDDQTPFEDILPVLGAPTDEVIHAVRVNVQVTGAYHSDLLFTLVHPDGTRIVLANRRGGPATTDISTTFDDTAFFRIQDSGYQLLVRPDTPLSALRGKTVEGDWMLEVVDLASGDEGVLVEWSLEIETGTMDVEDSLGNLMDQDADGTPGETGTTDNDIFANPKPVNGEPFNLPYVENTLPLIIPGPYVQSVKVTGQDASEDNLVLNGSVTSLDVTFDRDIKPTTFTGADIVRVVGPMGVISGNFTVTQIGTSKRDFRITFPTGTNNQVIPQTLNGHYSVILGSDIESDLTGEKLDTNHNAGLEVLRGTTDPTDGVQQTTSYNWGQLPATINAGATYTATINVNDAFLIRNLVMQFSLSTANVQNIVMSLVGPDGTTIQLFDGLNLRSGANFISTRLDDTATTPIQQATAPFTGVYNPQKPLGTFNGSTSNGAWRLVIRNRSTTGQNATLSAFSMTMRSVTPGTGLGEPVADQATLNFRIFNMDVLNSASGANWTAVGPIANNNEANAGQVTNVVVDPSDPSGNTVYATGAHSGVWKTTNFLTTAAGGPTWIPLTDFGPTNGLSIGSLVVLPRNNDPTKTIIIAGTGSGANFTSGGANSQGIGFLRSEDGGLTWKVLDSLTNYDAQGVYIPLDSPLRNREFDATLSFRMVVDPNLNPSNNQNIVYAAMTGVGGQGGLYRSMDSGKNWTRVFTGQVTDVALAQTQKGTSGYVDQFWVAVQGQGIYFTQNFGASFTLTSGVQGRTDVRDGDRYFFDDAEIPVTPSTSPNGAKGRITLATPVSQNNPLLDFFYRGWVYAMVAAPNGNFDGLYVSKDYGKNWTKVILPAPAVQDPNTGEIFVFDRPTNDETIRMVNNAGVQEYPVAGGTNFVPGRADEALAMAIDPRDPRIVYIGGTRLIRVDLTTMSDPYALIPRDNSDNDSSALKTQNQTTGGVVTKGTLEVGLYDPFSFAGGFPDTRAPQAYYNLARDPEFPFLALSSIRTYDVASASGGGFTNTGTDIVWRFHDYDASGNNNAQLYYNLTTITDPLTGQTRLLMSTMNGVYTSLDQGNGDIQTDIGTMPVVNGIRNGNIQNIRLTSGGAQPSQLAADLADALFYATTTTRGFPQSKSDILTTGDLVWNTTATGEKFTSGGGTMVLADPSGNGNVWKYKFPFRIVDSGGPGGSVDFLTVAGPGFIETSRTFGLIQAGDVPITGQGQWWADFGQTLDSETAFDDFYGARFAINKFNTDALIIGSLKSSPKVFRSTDGGLNWFPISAPAQIGNSMAFSLAFGAPDPTDPQQGISKDNFIYAGTVAGGVYVTRNGGGTWTNLTLNLDGSTVRAIHPSPVQGSYEVYVLTESGVYYKADSRDTATPWTNITSNLFDLTTNLFGDSTQQDRIIYGNLNAMVVDWRFTRPADTQSPSGVVHPYLYVAGDGGVFRSVNNGTSWSYFPDQGQGAAQAGGLLPRVSITDLVLLPGGFNGNTGQTDADNPYSMLLATTDGRGAFAIRLAPEPNVSGPRVEYVRSSDPSLVTPMSSVDIKFDKGVDPTTFDLNDIVRFTAPDGTEIEPTGLTNISTGGTNDLFRLTFDPISQNGVYTIVIGPNLSDFAGNRMNQTPDGVNGDGTSDQFTGRFFRNTGPDGPFAPAVIGGLSNGQIVANFGNGVNGYTRQPFFAMMPKTISWANVTTRDVNGDGQADVIGRMVQTGEWWVSLASPGGYLTSRWLTWSTSTPFVTPLFADFNGDGMVDLAYRNASNGQWIVGLSNGSGFQTSVWATWNPAVNWSNVVAADFNNDGFVDIAARNVNNGNMSVALSNGAAFQTSVWGNWGAWARTLLVDVRAGDFTGDGNADIVGRNRTTGAWTILESTGTAFNRGAFGSWARNVNWTQVIAGDFNNDGRLDLTGWNSANGQFIVGVSNGSAFQTSTWTNLARGVAYVFAGAGDFNNDGNRDLAFREVTTGHLRVLRSTGTSFVNSIWARGIFPRSVAWVHAGAGDIDGDSLSDVVALNPNTGVFRIGLSSGTSFGVSSFGRWMASKPNWTNVLTGDFNGDGKTDLAYRSLTNGQWYVSLSNGNQAYRTREWALWKSGTWSNVMVADVNGDGRDDIVGRFAASGGRSEIWVNLSDGNRFVLQQWATWNPGNWVNVQVGDFDDDGLADIVARNATTRQIWVSRSTGFNFEHTQWTTTAWTNTTWANVVVGDFNGDGRSDLAARRSNSGRWDVALSTGTSFGALTNWTASTWPGGNWADVRVMDLNGDGKDDLVGRNPTNGQLWGALANAGGTAFTTSNVGNWGAGSWRDVFVADMDGDGQDDLIGRLFSNGRWRVSLSNGTTLNNAFWDTWLANVVLENSRLLKKS